MIEKIEEKTKEYLTKVILEYDSRYASRSKIKIATTFSGFLSIEIFVTGGLISWAALDSIINNITEKESINGFSFDRNYEIEKINDGNLIKMTLKGILIEDDTSNEKVIVGFTGNPQLAKMALKKTSLKMKNIVDMSPLVPMREVVNNLKNAGGF